MNHNHFPHQGFDAGNQGFDRQYGAPFSSPGVYEQPYGAGFGNQAPGFGARADNPFQSPPGFDAAAASWAQPQEFYTPPLPPANTGNQYGYGNNWGSPSPGFESPGFGAPSYANQLPPYRPESGFGSNAGWGAPAQEQYVADWQAQPAEAQPGRVRAFVGRIKGMLAGAGERVDQHGGAVETAVALGRSLERRYNEMDPRKKAIAQGVGRGALGGLREGFDDRYRSTRTGKIKKVKLARDIASGNGTRVGAKLAFKAARGAVEGFSQVAQPMASEKHALAGTAVNLAAARAHRQINHWERRTI